MKYELRGNRVYTERGRLVATLDGDGNPVMEMGMAGPHSRGVREFLGKTPEMKTDAEEPRESEASPEVFEAEEAEMKTDAAEPRESEASPEVFEAEEAGVYIGSIPASRAKRGAPFREERELNADEWSVSTIPEGELPEFDAEFGVYTPGFQEYIKRHGLTEGQQAALVARVSKRRI